jgi:hypothetical protein
MVKKLFFFICLFPSVIQLSAKDDIFIHKGLFCLRGSLAYGHMTKLNANNIFLSGNIDYYFEDRISMRGDGYFFIDSYKGKQPFSTLHSLFAGPIFHVAPIGSFDPYVGLECGISIAKASSPCLGDPCTNNMLPQEMKTGLNPLISPVIGFNYFGTKWFHLTFDARYIAGTFSDNYNSAPLHEIRLSFGLGFNLF